jgi:hypothetical protein
VRKRLVAEGFEIETVSPQELRRSVASEIEEWDPIARRLVADAGK